MAFLAATLSPETAKKAIVGSVGGIPDDCKYFMLWSSGHYKFDYNHIHMLLVRICILYTPVSYQDLILGDITTDELRLLGSSYGGEANYKWCLYVPLTHKLPKYQVLSDGYGSVYKVYVTGRFNDINSLRKHVKTNWIEFLHWPIFVGLIIPKVRA